ncbi:MAG: 1-deoxy-D-xylulose-5-phosphate synthase [Lachnospiraceae bacterium]|nr:1-deoxy-D-xylulose-5-phosphate synthase [Lachnospiraceae bacterium]
MGIYLDKIKAPNDIKSIPVEKYPELAKEIRQFLVKTVSNTGGHLASNLGAVELTMALHTCLNLPEDKIIWDVGHQSYVHKILSGRKEQLNTIRQYKGLSGFPKEEESPCDAFDTGHSTTSISVAAGYARARDIKGEKYKVVAVIGDGSFSGGMAYEAINNLARYKTNTIIVLNDNEMSISKNVGGMASYLERIRTDSKYLDFKGDVENALSKSEFGMKLAAGLKKTKNSIRDLITPGGFFKDMGLGYFGPIDGHNIPDLIRAIEAAKTYKGAVVVHVITRKGKGYRHAENNPSKFHGIDPFVLSTGELKNSSGKISYTSIFGRELCKLAEKDNTITAITAAMPGGTGLTDFQKRFPKRFFDVGIAEEHAVTFAGGMAAAGMHPVVCIYSTFLQRAYDQILHDVCLTNKKVIFAIDRAGIVGSDGKTHQGIYDLAFLSTIPGLTVISPKDGAELVQAIHFAKNFNGPIAVRYPRGEAYYSGIDENPIEYGKAEIVAKGKKLAIISIGTIFKEVAEAAQMLEYDDVSVTLVNARFSNPMDKDMLDSLMNHKMIAIVEEGIASGGFGEHVATYLASKGYKGKILPLALPDIYLEHGTRQELIKEYGFDVEGLHDTILKNYKEIKS